MYLDIPANDNLAEPTMATFKETGVGRAVAAVELHLDGVWRWCAVTGWDDAGAVAAHATPIEESGDGPAILVHGGAHGLRLAPLGDEPAAAGAATVRWDLADPRQWAEPFLLCRPQTRFVEP